MALDVDPDLSLDPRIVNTKTQEAKDRALNQLEADFAEYKKQHKPISLSTTLRTANYYTAYAGGEFRNLSYENVIN